MVPHFFLDFFCPTLKNTLFSGKSPFFALVALNYHSICRVFCFMFYSVCQDDGPDHKYYPGYI